MSDMEGKEPEMNGLEESPEENGDVEMEEEELRIDFLNDSLYVLVIPILL